VPTWVGVFFSLVSSLIALRLIWVERDRRENAQAYLQTIRIKRTTRNDVFEAVEVWIFNGSEAPLPAASLHIRSRTRTAMTARRVSSERKSLDTSITAKSEAYEHVAIIDDPQLSADSQIDVYFRDGNNRVWRKEMKTYKLKRMSEKYVAERALLV